MAVLSALPRYTDRGAPFEAFVYRIAANKVADAQRSTMRGPVPTDQLPERVDDAPTPEEHAIAGDAAATIWRLMDKLSDQHREILVGLLDGSTTLEGRAIDTDLRWKLVIALSAGGVTCAKPDTDRPLCTGSIASPEPYVWRSAAAKLQDGATSRSLRRSPMPTRSVRQRRFPGSGPS